VVGGRLVNAYSYRDWVLSFLYRTANLSTSVAGIHPVPGDGIENVDVSHIIDGHLAYRRLVPTILEYVRAHESRDHQLDIVQLPAPAAFEKKEAPAPDAEDSLALVADDADRSAISTATHSKTIPAAPKKTHASPPTSPRRSRSPPSSPTKGTTLFTKIRRRARSRSSSSSSRIDPQLQSHAQPRSQPL
jgi:Protein of unknown function (DUF726)